MKNNNIISRICRQLKGTLLYKKILQNEKVLPATISKYPVAVEHAFIVNRSVYA